MTKQPQFTYTDFDCYVSQTFFVIKPQDSTLNLKYLTAILNSKLFHFWFYHRGKRKGEQLQIDKEPLLRVPIKKITKSVQQPFIKVVDQIINAKQKDPDINTSALECQIDKMVYELYGLTLEEIAIVERR